MMKQIEADGYVFNFADDVVEAIVFDSIEYNGVQHAMKSVDIIAEFPEEYLFIELKKYDANRGGIEFRCPIWDDKKLISSKCPLNNHKEKRDKASTKRIASDLRRKYCDTLLYYFAEGKLTKSVNYFCVIGGCDSAIMLRLQEILKHALPKGIPTTTRWMRPLVKNLAVVNVKTWNESPQLSRYGTCQWALQNI